MGKTVSIFVAVGAMSMAFLGCWSMPFPSYEFTITTSSLDEYEYREARSDIGSVYHYAKTNSDDTNRSDVWIYVASDDSTESFKIYPLARLGNATDLVIAKYDNGRYFTKKMNAYKVLRSGERKLNAVCESLDGETYRVSAFGQTYEFRVGHLPSYNYNFDWCDMAFMFRHLSNKRKTFSIGVIAPNSTLRFGYSGKAVFQYVGERPLDSRDCEYYEVSGDPFRKDKGHLYVDRDMEIVRELNMPAPNTGSYNSFKFRLVDESVMTEKEWNDFITAKTNETL